MPVTVRDVSRRIRRLFRWRDPDRFLQSVTGVVHVGANVGQERFAYARYGLHVIWIEPIPEVFAQLEQNIRGMDRQQAFNRLVTDRDGADYCFYVADNNGESSSIMELRGHQDIWPDVTFDRSVGLRSVTLTRLLEEAAVHRQLYDALVLDTQGSELLVLKGAVDLLGGFRFVKTEVPDFESYADCCQLEEMDEFMGRHGFARFSCHEFAVRAQEGSYYDVVYQRVV